MFVKIPNESREFFEIIHRIPRWKKMERRKAYNKLSVRRQTDRAREANGLLRENREANGLLVNAGEKKGHFSGLLGR